WRSSAVPRRSTGTEYEPASQRPRLVAPAVRQDVRRPVGRPVPGRQFGLYLGNPCLEFFGTGKTLGRRRTAKTGQDGDVFLGCVVVPCFQRERLLIARVEPDHEFDSSTSA